MLQTLKILADKKAKLNETKRTLEQEYLHRASKIDDEIHSIDSAVKTIEAAIEPFRCPDCKGSGVRRTPDAAGQMEETTCKTCKGTGIKTN